MELAYALATLALVISAATTWLLARQFAGTSLMDIPNERSSHVRPTPRGGGLAIMFACIIGWALLLNAEWLTFNTWFAFSIGGLLIGLVGFLDDRRLVSLEVRLAAQFAAAILGVALIGDLPPIEISGVRLNLGWGYSALAVLFLVWCTNLYNFMDGIDGIAAGEALLVAGATALLALDAGLRGAHAAMLLILAAAAAGFLIWNFPPAKIFMGSVGSEFLGYCVGLTAIHLASVDSNLFWALVILLGAFICDATVTLLMRLARRENILRPHRTHLYQLLAIRFGAHAPVTVGAAAVTLLWLAPFALAVARGYLDPLLGVVASYTPLALFVLYYRFRRAKAS